MTTPEQQARRDITYGSMAVVTRHGKLIHLWAGRGSQSKTICGLQAIDFAPDADPSRVTCSPCKVGKIAIDGLPDEADEEGK